MPQTTTNPSRKPSKTVEKLAKYRKHACNSRSAIKSVSHLLDRGSEIRPLYLRIRLLAGLSLESEISWRKLGTAGNLSLGINFDIVMEVWDGEWGLYLYSVSWFSGIFIGWSFRLGCLVMLALKRVILVYIELSMYTWITRWAWTEALWARWGCGIESLASGLGLGLGLCTTIFLSILWVIIRSTFCLALVFAGASLYIDRWTLHPEVIQSTHASTNPFELLKIVAIYCRFKKSLSWQKTIC
jgi:hypothetical protein